MHIYVVLGHFWDRFAMLGHGLEGRFCAKRWRVTQVFASLLAPSAPILSKTLEIDAGLRQSAGFLGADFKQNARERRRSPLVCWPPRRRF